MSYLPKDPIMLLSYVNTKLRDENPSFSDLVEDLDVDGESVKATLSAVGYEYDEAQNKFD